MAEGLADVYLRFEGEDYTEEALVGECNDEAHLGEDGWIQVKSFSWGFGFDSHSPGASEEDRHAALTQKLASGKPLTSREAKELQKALANRRKGKSGNEAHTWGRSGALNFERVSITKSADRMSDSLVEICHKGESVIDTVTLEVCRQGGGNQDHKMPFLRIIFEGVMLRSCTLTLATESLPTETIDFEYNTVRIETLWTDNATGDRLPQQPIKAGWDLENQEAIE